MEVVPSPTLVVISHSWLRAINPRPRAAFLDLGSNDLCDPSSSALRVAHALIRLARFLISGLSVDNVIIGQVTPRLREPYRGYNQKVAATNSALARMLSKHRIAHVHFTFLRGLRNPDATRFLFDGVHLNSSGINKYAQGIRGAFLRLLRGSL